MNLLEFASLLGALVMGAAVFLFHFAGRFERKNTMLPSRLGSLPGPEEESESSTVSDEESNEGDDRVSVADRRIGESIDIRNPNNFARRY